MADPRVSIEDDSYYDVSQYLRFESVPGDGDCFYSAVDKYVGAGIGAHNLRVLVANYMAENEDELHGFMPEYNHDAYVARVAATKSTRAWADHIEIETMMRVLHRPIVIMRRDADPTVVGDGEANQERPIFVLYNGHTHYDALHVETGVNAADVMLGVVNALGRGEQVYARELRVVGKEVIHEPMLIDEEEEGDAVIQAADREHLSGFDDMFQHQQLPWEGRRFTVNREDRSGKGRRHGRHIIARTLFARSMGNTLREQCDTLLTFVKRFSSNDAEYREYKSRLRDQYHQVMRLIAPTSELQPGESEMQRYFGIRGLAVNFQRHLHRERLRIYASKPRMTMGYREKADGRESGTIGRQGGLIQGALRKLDKMEFFKPGHKVRPSRPSSKAQSIIKQMAKLFDFSVKDLGDAISDNEKVKHLSIFITFFLDEFNLDHLPEVKETVVNGFIKLSIEKYDFSNSNKRQLTSDIKAAYRALSDTVVSDSDGEESDDVVMLDVRGSHAVRVRKRTRSESDSFLQHMAEGLDRNSPEVRMAKKRRRDGDHDIGSDTDMDIDASDDKRDDMQLDTRPSLSVPVLPDDADHLMEVDLAIPGDVADDMVDEDSADFSK